jgi:hypothetical protein
MTMLVHEQARVMSYLDIFWLASLAALLVLPLVLLMRRSVSEGGLVTHG